MNDYILTCDTAVDLDREYLEERDIPFISFHYTIDDVDYEDDLGRTVTYEEFYKKPLEYTTDPEVLKQLLK